MAIALFDTRKLTYHSNTQTQKCQYPTPCTSYGECLCASSRGSIGTYLRSTPCPNMDVSIESPPTHSFPFLLSRSAPPLPQVHSILNTLPSTHAHLPTQTTTNYESSTGDSHPKMVKEIKSDAELNEQLSSHGNLVVIDFFATWCGPCVKIAPFIEELSHKFSNALFLKIDVDGETVQETVQKYEINCMPTFVFLKNGQPVDRLEGASQDELESKVAQHH